MPLGAFPLSRGAESSSTAAFAQPLTPTNPPKILPSTEFAYGDKHIRLGLGRTDFAANLKRWEATLE